jgi:hypothetical protein
VPQHCAFPFVEYVQVVVLVYVYCDAMEMNVVERERGE